MADHGIWTMNYQDGETVLILVIVDVGTIWVSVVNELCHSTNLWIIPIKSNSGMAYVIARRGEVPTWQSLWWPLMLDEVLTTGAFVTT